MMKLTAKDKKSVQPVAEYFVDKTMKLCNRAGDQTLKWVLDSDVCSWVVMNRSTYKRSYQKVFYDAIMAAAVPLIQYDEVYKTFDVLHPPDENEV